MHSDVYGLPRPGRGYVANFARVAVVNVGWQRFSECRVDVGALRGGFQPLRRRRASGWGGSVLKAAGWSEGATGAEDVTPVKVIDFLLREVDLPCKQNFGCYIEQLVAVLDAALA